MALRLGRALGRGARRSASVSGLVVLALTVLYQVAFLGAVNTIIVNQLPERRGGRQGRRDERRGIRDEPNGPTRSLERATERAV